MNLYETTPEESPALPAQEAESTTQVAPAELLAHFDQEGDQLALMLEKLNRSFEEKLAALATKQLMAKLA